MTFDTSSNLHSILWRRQLKVLSHLHLIHSLAHRRELHVVIECESLVDVIQVRRPEEGIIPHEFWYWRRRAERAAVECFDGVRGVLRWLSWTEVSVEKRRRDIVYLRAGNEVRA